MAKKDERLSLPALGEYYDDLLIVDAWINNRTKATQGQSLLCAKLQEREPRVRDRVEYLAQKRGVSASELWLQILKGEAQKISPADIEEEAS
ncbi:hypothetical protein [Lusitaniella coriacea]|nr:hypothetical protein [Lusitaniella coriacea]